MDELKTAHDLSNGFRLLMDTVSLRLSDFLARFASCFARFEQIACHLLDKGIVNAIPKKVEEGDGGKETRQEPSSGDACGFGEGEGDTDVTDQVENLEQVEGLKVGLGILSDVT